MGLFKLGNFTLSSGRRSLWKIDCDVLTDGDMVALAWAAFQILPAFGRVEGVPTGGLRLAKEMEDYSRGGPLLIVDDVLTTGGSMERHRAGRKAIGLVLFARGPCPAWITPLFTLTCPDPDPDEEG